MKPLVLLRTAAASVSASSAAAAAAASASSSRDEHRSGGGRAACASSALAGGTMNKGGGAANGDGRRSISIRRGGGGKNQTKKSSGGGGVPPLLTWSLRMVSVGVLVLVANHRGMTSTDPRAEAALRTMLSGVPLELMHVNINLYGANATAVDAVGTGGLRQRQQQAPRRRPPCWSAESESTRRWLEGPRLGNAADPLLTPELARDLILNVSPLSASSSSDYSSPGGCSAAALGRTMCPAESRFRTWGGLPLGKAPGEWETLEEKDLALKDLAFRLSFLAIHEHQHRHARREAELRLGQEGGGCDADVSGMTTVDPPGIFDYECPDAKFLVSYMFGDHGLGHVVRNAAIAVLEVGLATDRVVLFVNGSPAGPRPLRHPWTLASCPGRDMQCFFMPMSPCTVTHEELENAPVIEEVRGYGKSRELDEKYRDHRVVIMAPHGRGPGWNWDGRAGALTRMMGSLADGGGGGNANAGVGDDDGEKKREEEERKKSRYGLDSDTLEQVSNVIRKSRGDDPWFMDHLAVFYVMRPNPTAQRGMDELMERIIPPGFDPETAIGLPIRSSDKCMEESECLSFEQYMRLAKSFAKKQSNRTSAPPAHDTIVLTTESLSILQARKEYEKDESFPFRFVANDEDVAQGTGNPFDYHKMGAINVTADDIMLSTMTSVKMQLMAESTVGNCCSNFHKMMLEFLTRGCGAARMNHFECLQENEDPEFRLCCEWSGEEECKKKKKKGDFGKDFEKGSDVLHPDLVEERKATANSYAARGLIPG